MRERQSDLEHIAPIIGRVMYEHAKPRALDAASRAREASYAVRAPQSTQATKPRTRMPVGSVSRGTVCPHCDAAAVKQGREMHCQWCGFVTVADSVTYAIVGACMLFDGSWPAHDGKPQTGESST